jgi:hypothetical protein
LTLRTSDVPVRALLPTGANWPTLMRLTPVLALPHAAANSEGGIRGRASNIWHLHSAWGRGWVLSSASNFVPCDVARGAGWEKLGEDRRPASRSGACVHASPEPIHADHANWESLNATGQIPLGQAEGPARRRRNRRYVSISSYLLCRVFLLIVPSFLFSMPDPFSLGFSWSRSPQNSMSLKRGVRCSEVRYIFCPFSA